MWSHLNVNLKTNKNNLNLIATKNRLVVDVAGSEGVSEMGEGGQMAQTSNYEVISHGDVMYSVVIIVSNTVLHIWKVLRK